jgi:hypothetical protein
VCVGAPALTCLLTFFLSFLSYLASSILTTTTFKLAAQDETDLRVPITHFPALTASYSLSIPFLVSRSRTTLTDTTPKPRAAVRSLFLLLLVLSLLLTSLPFIPHHRNLRGRHIRSSAHVYKTVLLPVEEGILPPPLCQSRVLTFLFSSFCLLCAHRFDPFVRHSCSRGITVHDAFANLPHSLSPPPLSLSLPLIRDNIHLATSTLATASLWALTNRKS